MDTLLDVGNAILETALHPARKEGYAGQTPHAILAPVRSSSMKSRTMIRLRRSAVVGLILLSGGHAIAEAVLIDAKKKLTLVSIPGRTWKV
jgi:hypothetical protein